MTDDKSTAPQAYTEANIKKLNPMEHVRLRPVMYVGGTDARALHHMIYEVVDNAIDEALAGRCDTIIVTLHDDNTVSVNDHGVGIPVGYIKQETMSTLELVLTQIGAGGRFDNSAYKVSGGLHGIGITCVNALSSPLIAEVRRDGYLWRQTYSEGVRTSDVVQVRELAPGETTGTKISFRPDFTILEPNEFNYDLLAQRFREIAFLVPRLTITLRDERVKPIPNEVTFHFEDGLGAFMHHVNRDRNVLHPVVHAERDVEIVREPKDPYKIRVAFALQFTDSDTVTELGYANTLETPLGGTHLTGMRSAVTTVLNAYALKTRILQEMDNRFSESEALAGLTAIVSIMHPHPRFESQLKVKLENPEVEGAVSQVVADAFSAFMEQNPDDARSIVEKCMASKRSQIGP